MRFQHFFLSFSLVVAVSGILGAVALVSLAERADVRTSYSKIAGTYQCWKSFIDTLGTSCGIQPALTLSADGSYRRGDEAGIISYDPTAQILSLPGSSIIGTGKVTAERIIFTALEGNTKLVTVFINENALSTLDKNALP